MELVIGKIPSFQQRLQFIANSLSLTSDNVNAINDFNQAERYEIVEPFIQALIKASEDLEVPEVPTTKIVQSNDPRALEMVDFLHKGNKIGAIKRFRDIFGAGLKDSKDEVERVFDFSRKYFTVDCWEYDGTLIWKR